MRSLDRGSSDAVVAAVVLTVSVEVPVPPGTEAGLSAHVGPRVAAGATVQVRATASLKPLTGPIVIVEVADAPGATVAGESAEAAIVKSAATAAVLNATVCITQLPPATTAVASQLPTADVIWCSALSPFGWVRATVVKPVPGPVTVRETSVPATTSSVGYVVVQVSLS